MISKLKINESAKRLYYQKGWWTSDTIPDAWNRVAREHPEKTYVKDDRGVSYTYASCDEVAERIAAWLAAVGVRSGDVVTFQLPTWADFCPVFLGVAKAGAVMHPVARNYNVRDLSFIMNAVGSRAFICPTFHHRSDHERQALECLTHVPTLAPERIMVLDSDAHRAREGFITLEEVKGTFGRTPEPPRPSSDDVACILSTSGTTGKPKQAMLTHNNILFSERAFVKGLPLDESSVMFMPSPLNHATGFFHGLISPFLLGGTTVLQQDFSARAAIEIMNDERATWSMGATPFVYDILNALEADEASVPTLKLFLSGGAPLPSSLVERARTHGIALCECYGSTESCPHAYVPPERCQEWNGRWSGIALEGVEMRIVDKSRREVARGVCGEEASRGPHVFVGYLGEPTLTDEVLDDDGWFYSGDLGIMDDEGRLSIRGRIKEIIIRGGENISMLEVDEAVDGWPATLAHAAIGAPDERMGERICLFAVPRPGFERSFTLEDLTSYLREKGVSKRLWPERIELIEAIPRTSTGKVRRQELTERLQSAETRRSPERDKEDDHVTANV